MGQNTNSTQVYSPFGSGYVPEAHDPDKPRARRNRSILLVGSLLVLSAVGAIAATTWHRSPPDVWVQEAPSSVLKLPGGFGIDDPVY